MGEPELNKLFQSTLPRGSDFQFFCTNSQEFYFNPRSLAGATARSCERADVSIISIHAPLRERQLQDAMERARAVFQSTLPCGSDGFLSSSPNCLNDFNPRSLAGATVSLSLIASTWLFQSTLPCGSDVTSHTRFASIAPISIHALLRERLKLTIGQYVVFIFQSTLPCGSD